MKNNHRKSNLRKCTFARLSKVGGFRSGSGSLLPASGERDVSRLAVVIEKRSAPSVEWSGDGAHSRIFRPQEGIGGWLVMDHKAINAGRRRERNFGGLVRSRSVWSRGHGRRIRRADAGHQVSKDVVGRHVVPVIRKGRSADRGGNDGGDNGFQHGLNLVRAVLGCNFAPFHGYVMRVPLACVRCSKGFCKASVAA